MLELFLLKHQVKLDEKFDRVMKVNFSQVTF